MTDDDWRQPTYYYGVGATMSMPYDLASAVNAFMRVPSADRPDVVVRSASNGFDLPGIAKKQELSVSDLEALIALLPEERSWPADRQS